MGITAASCTRDGGSKFSEHSFVPSSEIVAKNAQATGVVSDAIVYGRQLPKVGFKGSDDIVTRKVSFHNLPESEIEKIRLAELAKGYVVAIDSIALTLKVDESTMTKISADYKDQQLGDAVFVKTGLPVSLDRTSRNGSSD